MITEQYILSELQKIQAHLNAGSEALRKLMDHFPNNPVIQHRHHDQSENSEFIRYTVTHDGKLVVADVLKKRLFSEVLQYEAPKAKFSELQARYARGLVKFTPKAGIILSDPGELSRFEEVPNVTTADGKKIFAFIGWRRKRAGAQFVSKTPSEAPGNFFYLLKLLREYGYHITES